MKLEHNFIYWVSSLWVAVGDERWSFPTNLSPRSMRVVLLFLMTSIFLQQVHEFFWLILSPRIICTSSFHYCSPLLCRATFAGTIHPPYTFLKTANIPTYYGISIAIPRYIAMQLSTVPFRWHALLLSYCSLHDHVVDIVFVARPPSYFYTCCSWFIAYPGTPPEAFI